MVVLVGVTVVLPSTFSVPVTPLLMLTDVALVVVQLSVADSPLSMLAGVAAEAIDCGAGWCCWGDGIIVTAARAEQQHRAQNKAPHGSHPPESLYSVAHFPHS